MTDKYRINYTPKAKEDLKNIYTYIADVLKVQIAAKNQVNRIREQIRELDTMPERYAKVEWEPWNSMGMRKFSVNNFVIYYWVNRENKTVIINRIFYGGRDVESIILNEK